MRTELQISNLRKVFLTIIGPLAIFLTNEEIDNMANRLQDRVNNIKYGWIVKIKTKENKDKDWEDIEAEPTTPYASEEAISKKIELLLVKYPSILEIQITDVLDENHGFILVSTYSR